MLCIVACVAGLLASVHGEIIVYTNSTPHMIAQEFRDMPASFGWELPMDGMRGLLVAGNPRNGCTALQKPPVDENYTGKWIVLIARYDCEFEVKVRNAQLAGYDCAIVHNVNSSDLETMSAKNAEDITIPSVFVSDNTGLALSQDYLYLSGYYIMVNGELPFNINTHLLLPFAIVVVLCLVVILIFMIVKCIKDRRRARRHRLPNRCLKKIPTCKFSKGDPYDTCAICLDDYTEGERLRVLPCAHAYHAKCIDPWLTQNRRVCPVCKRRVLAIGEPRRRRDSNSDSDDTEPLINEQSQTLTQGGTFEQQSENPFARATRFMARLRARAEQPAAPAAPADTADTADDNEEAPSTEIDQDNTVNDENVSDTQPLIADTVSTQVERRARRSRRARTRSEPRSAPAPTPAPVPQPGLHSADHSINNETDTETAGEIGVAALPATLPHVTPRHMKL